MEPKNSRPPLSLAATLLLLPTMIVAARAENKAELLDARKIWDQAPCNMCTDLIRFREQWFCCFREGADHGAPGRDQGPFDGKLRMPMPSSAPPVRRTARGPGRTWLRPAWAGRT